MFVADPFGSIAHGPAFERAGQSIGLHVVRKRGRAKLGARTDQARMRGTRHVLRAAAKHHPGILAPNRTIRLHGCFQPRAAHLVDGHGGDVVGASGPQGNLPSGVLSQARLQHTAHQGFVDDRGIDALQGGRRHLGTEIGGGGVGESAQEAADGGANSGENYGF